MDTPSQSNRELRLRLWQFVKPYRKRYALGILCGVLSSLLMLAYTELLNRALDAASPTRPQLGGATPTVVPTAHPRFAWELLIAILAIMAVRGVFVWAQSTLVAWSGLRTVTDLRNAVYERVQRLSLSYFESRPTGQLISRMTADMGVLQQGLVTNVSRAVDAPLQIVLGISYITWKSPLLALLLLLCIPMINSLIRKAGLRMKRATGQINAANADLAQVLEETISGVRVVKSFAMEDEEIARFEKLSKHVFGSVMRSVRVTSTLQPMVEVVSAVGFLLILGVSLTWIANGTMSMGLLLLLVMWIDRVRTSWQRIGDIVMTYNATLTSASHAFTLLDEVPEVQDRPDAVAIPPIHGNLEFDHVTFCYDDETPVLRDISFQVRPGECVALVGLSGAGKTTLVNLVPRFYDPTRGAIRADGLDLREVTMKSLRQQIGIVPQETLLFSGSVYDNIAYGSPGASREEVERAARVAYAHDFITALPEGYDTLVGERGAKLSGGQRQRLAIARAVLRNPRILILDEATSSLDTESEQLVQQAMEVLMRGRTTLVIAHRLSTIRGADRILVLEKGRLAEEGSHDQLIATAGLYSRLHQIQFDVGKTAVSG
ncbi:MAG TPA: ABC transporter ATP-binding protein [Armatimonadota bacterium]|jgi:subfamily B ATP-binding cassette protein MsbA